MEFRASMDTVTKIITSVVSLVFAGIVLTTILVEGDGENDLWPAVLVAVLFLTIYGLVYMYRPIGYEITDAGLLIRRPFDVVKVPKSRIVRVFPVEKRRIRWAIRTFGVGGMFGYFGTFYTPSLGSMTWYLTRLDNAVMVETRSGKIMVSPDERDRFISALNPVA